MPSGEKHFSLFSIYVSNCCFTDIRFILLLRMNLILDKE